MDHSNFRQETSEWLEGFPFQWFCTLTSRPHYTKRQRQAHLLRFESELKHALGTSDFNFVAIPENGRTGEDYHVHVVIGGLSDSGWKQHHIWMKRWRELSGDALIEDFISNKGGIPYMLKNATPDGMDEWILDLASHTRLQSCLGK